MSRRTAFAALETVLWPLLTAALLLALWTLAVRWSGTTTFPSPAAVYRGALELAQRHVLGQYIVDSLRHVLLGFGLASLLAVPAGLALGWYPAAAAVVNPLVQILRPISPIAWIPISIVLVGIGEPSAIFLIFLAAFFPVLVSTISAVTSVSTVYRRAGSNFGLSPLRLLSQVVLPAALPDLWNGLRIAFGIAWVVLIAAEMVAVDSGLGYLVIDARNAGKRYDLVVAAMILIGTLGFALDLVFRLMERAPLLRWRYQGER